MLGNFIYNNPTCLYFGDKALDNLEKELTKYGPTVQFIYGGGSIKKTGLYDEIMAVLHKCGKIVIEDGGVMPNPTLDKLLEGAKLAREHKVDFLLAVGGGSVVDYTKGVAAAAYCEEDPWEKYYVRQEEVTNPIIPLGCVLTMVGTGSEMNGGSVITNTQEKLKFGRVYDVSLYPRFAILNPFLTYTIPPYQMVAGFFDIMSHLFEQYFSDTDDSTSDYIIEGLMKSLIHSTPIAVENPSNYEARSNIMWIATWALNTLVSCGKTTDWSVHMIGQQIGAYTNATHGMTLSAITIPYFKFILPYGVAKFKRYAVNVWNVQTEGLSDHEIALTGLACLEKYMKELGLVMSITDLGVKPYMIKDIARSTPKLMGGYHPLSVDEIEEVLITSL